MPNSLAHIGIHGLLTRKIIKSSDFKWIFLGTLIPDIPWITKRLIMFAVPSVNFYDLRLFVLIQASLFFSLILSASFSLFSSSFKKTFLILTLGSFIHLLLDSLQIKWANGVHLLAPFDWSLFQFSLFWPESFLTYSITLFGLIYFFVVWKKSSKEKIIFRRISIKKIMIFFLLLSIYYLLPFYFFSESLKENNHYIKTLRNPEERIGKYFELDRADYLQGNSNLVVTFAKDTLKVQNLQLAESVPISVKGVFTGKNTIRVIEYHLHYSGVRDYLSYAGIFLIFFLWIYLFSKTMFP